MASKNPEFPLFTPDMGGLLIFMKFNFVLYASSFPHSLFFTNDRQYTPIFCRQSHLFYRHILTCLMVCIQFTMCRYANASTHKRKQFQVVKSNTTFVKKTKPMHWFTFKKDRTSPTTEKIDLIGY